MEDLRNMTEVSWEHFRHEADIGIRGTGDTLEEAFAQAAVALTAVITEPEKVVPARTVAIHCENTDRALLLVDWINALVYEMATRRMLFSEFTVRIEGPHLDAVAEGEAIDVARHQPAAEVKGATYTGLNVGRDASGRWTAQCVVDV